jgi:tetratricopeptide (TPR) repeat protein
MLGDWFRHFLRIMLPFVVAVLFNFSPEATWIKDAFQLANGPLFVNHPALSALQFERIPILKPWRSGLFEKAGYQYIAAAKLAEAVSAFQKAHQSNQLSTEGSVVLGDTLIQLDQGDAALQVWKDLLKEGAAPEDVYLKLFNLQRSKNQLPEALSTLRSWQSSFPADPQAAYLLGIFLVSQHPQEALTFLLEASAHNPDYKNASVFLGKTVSVILSTQDKSTTHLLAGHALAKLGEWDLASAAFEDAIHISPDVAEAWALLGEAKQNLGFDAGHEIEKAQSIAPQSILVRALSARYWRWKGKPELSLAYLYPLARQEPDNCIWQAEIGSTLTSLGNTAAAQHHYQLAARIDPASTLCWQALADFSVENSILVRQIGLQASRQALFLLPGEPEVLNRMATVLMSLQDSNGAERFFQLALLADQYFAPAHLGLGSLYLFTDRKPAAYYHLQEAKNLSLSSSQVNLIAERLINRYY